MFAILSKETRQEADKHHRTFRHNQIKIAQLNPVENHRIGTIRYRHIGENSDLICCRVCDT